MNLIASSIRGGVRYGVWGKWKWINVLKWVQSCFGRQMEIVENIIETQLKSNTDKEHKSVSRKQRGRQK